MTSRILNIIDREGINRTRLDRRVFVARTIIFQSTIRDFIQFFQFDFGGDDFFVRILFIILIYALPPRFFTSSSLLH